MGGGYYDCDVALEARSSQRQTFRWNEHIPTVNTDGAVHAVHEELDPYQKIRECNNDTPIVVALDVTRSRGEDTKLVYDKLPMFLGQMMMKNYVPGPAISFAAIGDATDGDRAPLQVGQFEADNRLDDVLSRIWIEEGGGGTGQESYELAAYFYNRTHLVQNRDTGKKAYCFFIGDEGFYPFVNKQQVQDIIGETIPEDIPSVEIFRQLQERFHVFFIYPKKSWEERKSDIDAEIKKRVEAAGGQYAGVDIRASLLWNNRNDLDLHVITPSGERIFYGSKKSHCGGWLDVDMNVSGETTKPVENIRWSEGKAPSGRYQVIVQNFAFHEHSKEPTPYRVELEINGKVRHFTGEISPKGETKGQSDQIVHTFTYTPRQHSEADDAKETASTQYDGYKDERILKQWSSVLPSEHILLLEDPRSILDVMMGALALTEGSASLEQILLDLRDMGQSLARQEHVSLALEPLSHSLQNKHIQIKEPRVLKKKKYRTRKKRTKHFANSR